MTMAFETIPTGLRSSKPRQAGLTMLVDSGFGMRQQQDLLDISGAYVDLVKILSSTSRLISEEYLIGKLKLYAERHVLAFPGGVFMEYALHQESEKAFFDACVRIGYPLVEVSDDMGSLGLSRKAALIRAATEEYGLKVLGEAGGKGPSSTPAGLLNDIQACLDAGAWKVFVEAAEFFPGGTFSAELVNFIAAGAPLDRVIFELPGPWIHDIHAHQVYATMAHLVRSLGNEVNIGNASPELLLRLEAMRQGIA